MPLIRDNYIVDICMKGYMQRPLKRATSYLQQLVIVSGYSGFNLFRS